MLAYQKRHYGCFLSLMRVSESFPAQPWLMNCSPITKYTQSHAIFCLFSFMPAFFYLSLRIGHWDFFDLCHFSHARPFEAWWQGVHKGFLGHRWNNPESPNGIYAGLARFNISSCMHYGHRAPKPKWKHKMADNCCRHRHHFILQLIQKPAPVTRLGVQEAAAANLEPRNSVQRPRGKVQGSVTG